MSVANLGSIATSVLIRLPDIPSHVSGQMLQIVDEQRLYLEQRTGLTIGSVGIAERFQPALTALSSAAALEATKLEGGNAGVVEIGDLRVEKRGDDNITTAAQAFWADAEKKMKALGVTIRFKRAIGG